jgi:hypothetical protein
MLFPQSAADAATGTDDPDAGVAVALRVGLRPLHV